MEKNFIQQVRTIFSVSSLTKNIKLLLEENYPIIWISGEISNLRIPSSGHAYFTLKDEKAQIATVMFKGQMRHLSFTIEDGARIVGMGRVSVYEPKGSYQLILEYIEPHGLGALQLAFEQLKRKLEKEGLFDSEKKRPIPMLPQKIGVITSPTGAVLKDILNILHRRFPNIPVDVFPVRVQGDTAPDEVVRAIKIAHTNNDIDVLILARGGGSLEDLSVFNSEMVAYAIFKSVIPIISAIGHETDFTIADFVADLRAPTPSAAAELVVPIKDELQSRCFELKRRCDQAMARIILRQKEKCQSLRQRLVHPRKKIEEYHLSIDDYRQRLERATKRFMNRINERHTHLKKQLLRINIGQYITKNKGLVEFYRFKLTQSIRHISDDKKKHLQTVQASMKALDPKAVLLRGYSITRIVPQKIVVMNPDQVVHDQPLEILLAKGNIMVKVTEKG